MPLNLPAPSRDQPPNPLFPAFEDCAVMPLKAYFLWMSLALCVALYGASFALGSVEVKPNGAQDMPLEIQKMRASEAAKARVSGKIGPQATIRTRTGGAS
jgi:hypothetical protein